MNKNNELCPDSAGLEPFAMIGCVPEGNGAGAAEVEKYVPTRFELEVLAKHWASTELDLDYLMFSTDTVGSNWLRKHAFAGRRLNRLCEAIGVDAVKKIVSQARYEFAKEADRTMWDAYMRRDHDLRDRRLAEVEAMHRSTTKP